MKREVRLTKSDGCWIVAEVTELPGCISQGRDKLEALTNIREAMTGWLWAEEEKKVDVEL